MDIIESDKCDLEITSICNDIQTTAVYVGTVMQFSKNRSRSNGAHTNITHLSVLSIL